MNSQANIEEVIKGAKLGEKAAQSRLYMLYKNSLFTLAKRIVKNDQEAEQILQDTFIQVFKSLATYEGNASIYTWMRTIAIRTTLKSLKSLQKEIIDWNAELTQQNEPIEIEAPQSDPEELNFAFTKLSPGYRTILTLYYIEDFSHKEISEQLGISVGTSKSQLHFAKIKLKEILENGRK